METTPSAPKAAEYIPAAVEATRSTFMMAFAGLLGSGPFSAIAINATAATDPGAYRETSATAAFNVHCRSGHPLQPYATAGGGVLFGSGALPAPRELSASYRFSILGELPIVETDDVHLRVERPASFVIVLGGGARARVLGCLGGERRRSRPVRSRPHPNPVRCRTGDDVRQSRRLHRVVHESRNSVQQLSRDRPSHDAERSSAE